MHKLHFTTSSSLVCRHILSVYKSFLLSFLNGCRIHIPLSISTITILIQGLGSPRFLDMACMDSVLQSTCVLHGYLSFLNKTSGTSHCLKNALESLSHNNQVFPHLVPRFPWEACSLHWSLFLEFKDSESILWQSGEELGALPRVIFLTV